MVGFDIMLFNLIVIISFIILLKEEMMTRFTFFTTSMIYLYIYSDYQVVF